MEAVSSGSGYRLRWLDISDNIINPRNLLRLLAALKDGVCQFVRFLGPQRLGRGPQHGGPLRAGVAWTWMLFSSWAMLAWVMHGVVWGWALVEAWAWLVWWRPPHAPTCSFWM